MKGCTGRYGLPWRLVHMESWLLLLCTSVLLYCRVAYCKKTLSIVLRCPPTLGSCEGPVSCSFAIVHSRNPIAASPRFRSNAHDQTLTITARPLRARTESTPSANWFRSRPASKAAERHRNRARRKTQRTFCVDEEARV